MGEGAQTPGVWVKSAGGGGFDAMCRAALAACGIDPDNFGSYSQRLAAQSKARNDYRNHRIKEAKEAEKKSNKRPVPPNEGGHDATCPYPNKDKPRRGDCDCYKGDRARAWYADPAQGRPNDFLVANSESGHEGQNAFSQLEGRRGDPCANVPPPTMAQQSADGGSYGYDMERAACMDHYGAANLPGTPHYEVTQGELAFAQGIKPDLPDGRVSREAMRQGVRETALRAVRGPDALNYQDDPEAAKRAKTFSQDQQAMAARLHASEGGQPNSAGTDADKAKVQEIAADCIVSHWDAMVDQIRWEAIDRHSVAAKSDACKEQISAENEAREQIRENEEKRTGKPQTEPADVENFSELPPERQRAVVQDLRTKDATETEQERLERLGATRLAKGANGQPPTARDCRAYQANWLANATGNNGKLPDFTGRVPYREPETTTHTSNTGDQSGETF